MRGICRECGEAFRGRSDKRFCSDACRNAYHNTRNRETSGVFRRVHIRLKQNYRILQARLGGQACRLIKKQELLSEGFDPDLITGITRSSGGAASYHLYDLRLVWRGGSCWVQREENAPGPPGGDRLFPVLGAEFQGGHNNVLAADLPDEQPVLHYG